MDAIAFLIDFILHVDKHLQAFVVAYGPWVYALLFAIVFVETGVVVMPFLPGDSLLFIVGALCGAGLMNFPLACAVLARFMPFVRTFAPFVAGVAAMRRSAFTAYNVGGAVLWVMGICSAGYFFGNFAWVQRHLDKIIWALILVPGLLAIGGAWRASRAERAAAVR